VAAFSETTDCQEAFYEKHLCGESEFWRTEQTVSSLFDQYASVDRVNLVTDDDTGQPKGYGFVEMPNDDEAMRAISAVNGIDVRGRTLVINEAHPKTDRPGGGKDRHPEKRNVLAVKLQRFIQRDRS
jgi:cold-inducible RNA-binding protein